jgi:hypothetical protein
MKLLLTVFVLYSLCGFAVDKIDIEKATVHFFNSKNSSPSTIILGRL